MAKDPAFLFYHHDFLVGTTFMTLEEKGAYITLLCFLADRGELKVEEVERLVPEHIWKNISGKFIEKKGKIHNKRLKEEIEKRRKYTESRRKNLMLYKHMYPHMREHMENVNENENRNINENIKDVLLRLTKYYVAKKQWDPANLITQDYTRIYKRIKELLVKADKDLDMIEAAIDWTEEQGYCDWTLETVIKKFENFRKSYAKIKAQKVIDEKMRELGEQTRNR